MKCIAPVNATVIAQGPDQFKVVDGLVEVPPALAREMGLEAAPETPEPKKADPKGIGELSAEQAIAAVKAAESLEALSALSEQEEARKGGARTSVAKAIEAQLEALSASK